MYINAATPAEIAEAVMNASFLEGTMIELASIMLIPKVAPIATTNNTQYQALRWPISLPPGLLGIILAIITAISNTTRLITTAHI